MARRQRRMCIRDGDSPLVLSAETAKRICIEVSEANSIDVENVRHGTFPFFDHLSEYAIDIRFAPESSHLRVLPEFAHQDFPDLTKSSKQALEKSIS